MKVKKRRISGIRLLNFPDIRPSSEILMRCIPNKIRINPNQSGVSPCGQEMKEMRTRVEGMTSRVTELEATNTALQRRIGELTAQIDEMGRMHR